MEARTALPGLAALGTLLGLLGMATPAAARQDCVGRDTGVRLTVEVGRLKSETGEVTVTIYPSDPSRFLAPRGKLLRLRIPASAPTTEACFNLPKADIYAVAVYHDANGNHDFDRNAVGLPTEGYGFSNDAPSRFGVPSFDSARFAVKSGENTIRVRMRYGK
ncbi:DUF2141 domain-containing protein [Caulobacter radicis]|jgi:uncharacterized protein (DUF2141 family)|uniref:DUF2141 domain-containing protein n=1 Tax=Caulobacter radicis TaxID=2172650 RepID=A0A2T9JKV1_9CAUL|nr:DUF2141 domain-containing protein [Caulobacter radicis]PVM84286.1 hypothetical protein DDF65_08650 [Caulobacter radicis]